MQAELRSTALARTLASVTGAASPVGWRWVLLGMAGSSLLAAVSPPLLTRFDGAGVSWWYELAVPGGNGAFGAAAAYCGITLLLISWVVAGRRLRRYGGTLRVLWLPAVAWTVPLLVGPPLFSRDMYSYLSQATLTELHLSPYTHAAAALAGTGRAAVLHTVPSVWRHTVSPYGPLFLWLGAVLVHLAGRGVVAGILIMRLPAVAGVLLMAIFVPRLARSYGADPGRALWIGVLSPLVLLDLIAAGHNDALMVGLMAAGLALAGEDHALAGVAVCAVAAMVKLPALVGCVAIAVAWARAGPNRASAARSLASAALVSVGTVTGISAFSGLGFGWLSPTVLLTPAKGSIELTPSTAIGDTLARAAHLMGFTLAVGPTVTVVWVAMLLGAGLIAVYMVLRCRMDGLVPVVATALLSVVVAGPAMWPWYLTWGFTLLAVLPGAQWSPTLQAATLAACLVLAPTGQINVTSGDGPYVAAGWLVAATVAAAGAAGRRRRATGDAGRPRLALVSPTEMGLASSTAPAGPTPGDGAHL